MEPWAVAVLVKPVALLVLFVPAVFGKVMVRRYMRDGRLKRLLLS